MAGKAIAIDVGSHSIKAIGVQVGKTGLAVTRFGCTPAGEGVGPLRAAGIGLKGVVCGLAGRDMNLRYSQVPPTPDWQLKNLMDLEIQDLAQQSGGALSADYNLLPPADPEAGVDTVLLALAKDDALARQQDLLSGAGGSIDAFIPNCVALYNAWLKCGPAEDDAVVCLANVGHETIDIALVRGQDLLFARNLSGGGKVLDDAIAAAFNVSDRKAETLKRDLLDLDPQSRGRFASGQAEKVTMAAGGAANAIVAAIQSSLAFCKAQTKIADLRLDKVLLAGGSARLKGLRGLLREALRCPVEIYDPFANLDLSGLPPEDQEQLAAMRSEAVIALGLAVSRCDDSLYSLEILPEAVRKKKRFAERTIWNIAAGAVGTGLLAVAATQGMSGMEDAGKALAAVQRQKSLAEGTHQDAVARIEANKIDRAIVEHLSGHAAPLHGSLRALRAVTTHVPPQVWLTKVELQQKGASNAKRPVLLVNGFGKELSGEDVGSVLGDYATKLRAELDKQGMKLNYIPDNSSESRVKFTFEIALQEGS